MFTKSIAAQRSFKLSLLASIAVFGAVASAPAVSATANATASADVITPIAVTKAADLAFGKFAAGAGGSVTVNTGGVRSQSGVVGVGGTASTASFSITGEANATYAISFTGSSTELTSGANKMPLALFSDLTGAGATSGNVLTGQLSAGGTQVLYVGGTLTVAANQAGGSYSGTINTDVQYN
jgi:hypothetical protein